jgi:hypothetical protein
VDKGEFHFKEYERALDLLNQGERNLDRLALLRTLFLVFAFLFFRNYLINFNEIQSIRSKLDSLAQTDKDSTVFGLIAAHQKIENSVFVPDETAQTLIELIPKLSAFLGENLTLENQASRPVSEVLIRATKKPERISIENQYLPKLSIPVSYSTLALFVYLLALGSYFNFSFRRFRMGVVILYLDHNLAKFQECMGYSGSDLPLVRSRLYMRRFCSAHGTSVPPTRAQMMSDIRSLRVKSLVSRMFAYMLETEGESPFRFLTAAITAFLFLALGIVTVEIVAGEFGLARGSALDAVYLSLITLIPAIVLWKLNHFVESRFSGEELPYLPPSDET